MANQNDEYEDELDLFLDDSSSHDGDDEDDSEFEDEYVNRQFKTEYRKAQKAAAAKRSQSSEGFQKSNKPVDPPQPKGRKRVASTLTAANSPIVDQKSPTYSVEIGSTKSSSGPLSRGAGKKQRIRSPTPEEEQAPLKAELIKTVARDFSSGLVYRGVRQKWDIHLPTPKEQRASFTTEGDDTELKETVSSDSSPGDLSVQAVLKPGTKSESGCDSDTSGLSSAPSILIAPLGLFVPNLQPVRAKSQEFETDSETDLESSLSEEEESESESVQQQETGYVRSAAENLRPRQGKTTYFAEPTPSRRSGRVAKKKELDKPPIDNSRKKNPRKSTICGFSYRCDSPDLDNPGQIFSLNTRVLNMRNNTVANGRSSDIVQAYEATQTDLEELMFKEFKELKDEQKVAIIRKEAEDNGMEKPKGYDVSFHYNPRVEYHHFGSSHPMKPWRLTLTKHLILAYGLEYTMDLYEPQPATFEEIEEFHDHGYLSFLQNVTPQKVDSDPDDQSYLAYGFGGESNDCPVFDGLWNYVSLYSGATLHAARSLANKTSDIAINWSGGLHHAKKNAASGFCYVNDIVLAIQQLLTRHQRVLYIDIDVHHGDGVEEAFKSTDRVFTLSYHKYGTDRNGWPFFPGTGNIDDTGPKDPANRGKAHCLNIPLEDGIDDDQYKWLFKQVTGAVIEKYRPGAIVLQCGADSLGGDRLGRFNLNISAHGFCVEFVKGFKLPLLLVGGGGYTPRNVARTWCHETAVCVGATLHNNLPTHLPYIQAFQGEENGGGILYPALHNTKRHENVNTATKLGKIVQTAMENLRYLEGAPSVVVNTRGLREEQLLRAREEVEEKFREEREERERDEGLRRRRERNIGGRGEYRFRG